MSPTLDAIAGSWPFDPWLLAALGLSGAIYLRGWLVLHGRDPGRWTAGQLVAFGAWLATIFLALGSPIEPFASWLLQVHMIQHLLLMMVAPPLFWLGAPWFPLLRGMPGPIRSSAILPVLRDQSLRRCCRRLTHPALALPLFLATHLDLAPPLVL